MKCPKCSQELKEGTKFCTKCGVNLAEAQEEMLAKKREEENLKRIEQEKLEEAKRKEEEDKLKLQELREEEKTKNDENSGEKSNEVEQEKEDEFKVKKEEKEPEKNKKTKKKKGFFRKLLDKIILIIIIAAILIGGVYYLYKEELLPDFISDQIEELVEKFNFVKENTDKLEYKEAEKKDEEKIDWEVEPSIEADDIISFNDILSIIKKDGKFGLISNETGKVVLEPKYDSVLNIERYKVSEEMSTAKEGIVLQEGDKYYSVDSKYQKADEVYVIGSEGEPEYYYDHNDEVVYESILGCEKYTPVSESSLNGKSKLSVCTNLDIVTIDGRSAKDDDLTKEGFEIDFDKTKIYDKGYFDVTTGKLIINCDYEEAEEFSEGYAAVKKEGKAGFIDENGETVVEFYFENTRSIHNGLAWVKKDGKWGLVKIDTPKKTEKVEISTVKSLEEYFGKDITTVASELSLSDAHATDGTEYSNSEVIISSDYGENKINFISLMGGSNYSVYGVSIDMAFSEFDVALKKNGYSQDYAKSNNNTDYYYYIDKDGNTLSITCNANSDKVKSVSVWKN